MADKTPFFDGQIMPLKIKHVKYVSFSGIVTYF